VVLVQKYYRRMLSKCHAERLRVRAKCQLEAEEARRVMKAVEGERRLQRDFQRRLNPRSKDDFALLFNAMEGLRLLPLCCFLGRIACTA